MARGRCPSTIACGDGPPPHRFATGRIGRQPPAESGHGPTQASLSPPRPAAKATRVTELSLRIAAFADRRPKLLALLLGAISATGFAPLHFWPLTLMALAGWMALVARSPRGWRAAGVGWAFGVGHFAIGLNWIATAFT